jgi:ProP effector
MGRSLKQINQDHAVIASLSELFPRCFWIFGRQRRPVAIGIRAALAPLVPFEQSDLEAALKSYVKSDGYLRACVNGAPRLDLNGNIAGEITASEAEYATKLLVERERCRRKRKEKQAGRKQNEATAQRSQRKEPTASIIAPAKEQHRRRSNKSQRLPAPHK